MNGAALQIQIDLTDRLASGPLPCDWFGCGAPAEKLAWIHFDPAWAGTVPWKGAQLRRPFRPQFLALCPAHHDGDHAVRLFRQFIVDPSPRCPKCTRLHAGCCIACGVCPDCGCPAICPTRRPVVVPTPASIFEVLQ